MQMFDVVIIGAGAAGMMCAIEAAKRGRTVLVVEHQANPGEKIRISGGGRCNFTNLGVSPDRFISSNPRFCVSALARYNQHDFIAMVGGHGIAWHEKTLGQLFCDGSAKQIIAMLVDGMRQAGAELRLSCEVEAVRREGSGYEVTISGRPVTCTSLVVASGGKSIPKMGATGLAYRIAHDFGVPVTGTRPGLVPLTFDPVLLRRIKPLSGVSVQGSVSCGRTTFNEAVLFTHRGISGPAVLQISSHWREGDNITLMLAPAADIAAILKDARASRGRQALRTVLSDVLPRRLAGLVEETAGLAGPLAQLSDAQLDLAADAVNNWTVKPAGSEGYRTAEVTLGGIDTDALDQRTMQVRAVPGLYFIGEAVDVTGWLGGYNFQWAWSSGWVAGQAV